MTNQTSQLGAANVTNQMPQVPINQLATTSAPESASNKVSSLYIAGAAMYKRTYYTQVNLYV